MKQVQHRGPLALARPIGVAEVVVFLVPCLLSVGAGLMIIGVNLKVVETGAGVEFLGLLGFLRHATFLLGSISLGALSDRLGRRERIVVVSCFLHAAVAFATASAGSLGPLVAVAVALALTEAMLWPSFEAWLGERAQKGRRRRWLGIFNLGWSSGFASGSSLVGVAKEMGGRVPFYAAAVACLLGSMVALWMRKAGERLRNEKAVDEPSPLLSDQPVWMRLSWVANFGNVFCLAAILNLFPKQGSELHLSESLVAFLCGLVVMGELSAFIFTALSTSWQGRIKVLVGAQGLAALGLLWLGRGEQVLSLGIVFPVVGIAAGIGFSSSLLFSVSSEHGKGMKAAVHEGVAALGALTAPPLGGLLAALAGRTIPHLLSGLVLAACILVETRVLRRSKPIRRVGGPGLPGEGVLLP